MDYLQDVAEIAAFEKRVLDIVSPQKIVAAGHFLALDEKTRLIDFGCGIGEALELWTGRFGISGVGIELDNGFCEWGRKRLAKKGFDEQIEIVCSDAAKYEFEPHAFDVAVCLGASFIWGGYRGTIRAIRKAIRPGGRLAIGEPYYVTKDVPPELVKYEGNCPTENEIFQITREEGFEVEYAVRASADDWDRYVFSSCYQDIRRIRENPGHPDREEWIRQVHRFQDMYPYRLRYQGWAVYVLGTI